MTTGTRPVGDFCWINILTARPTEARDFFAALLGWTYVEMPGMGHRIQVGGRDVGGLFDLEAPNTPPGARATIGVMLKVENADATCDRVRDLGGAARTPFDVGEAGRMAVCHDPTGAEFDVWEPKRMQGTDADSDAHGAPSWFEAQTSDVDAASAFYTDLVGWRPVEMGSPEAPYVDFQLDGRDVAGMMALRAETGGARPAWWTYFTVRDVDAAVRDAAARGGQVVVPPYDIAGVGRMATLRSPQGVSFAVVRYEG